MAAMENHPPQTTVQEEEQPNVVTPPKTGILDRIRQHTPKFILNNAPRIVGLMKFTGAFLMTRGQKGYFAACGYGLMLGNALLFTFGGKKTAEQKEALQAKNEEIKQKGPILGHIAKVLQPQNYPYESAATVYTAGSVFWLLGGLDKDGGFGRGLAGLASLASDANAAFTKEKIGASYVNPHRKGSLNYYFAELKSRPVLVSSSLNIISDVAEIATGIRHKMKHGAFNKDFYIGLILMAANLFQGIFVNKNEYSLEKTGDELAKSKKSATAVQAAEQVTDKETKPDQAAAPSREWKATIQPPEAAFASLAL